MRSLTRATIRIITMENLPNVASEDEEMVQISGDISAASGALLQVTTRLRAYVFEMEGSRATMPYHPMFMDMPHASRHGNSDGNSRGRGRGRGCAWTFFLL